MNLSVKEVGHQAGGCEEPSPRSPACPQPTAMRRQVWRWPAPRAHSQPPCPVLGSRATASCLELAEEIEPSGRLEIIGLEVLKSTQRVFECAFIVLELPEVTDGLLCRFSRWNSSLLPSPAGWSFRSWLYKWAFGLGELGGQGAGFRLLAGSRSAGPTWACWRRLPHAP